MADGEREEEETGCRDIPFPLRVAAAGCRGERGWSESEITSSRLAIIQVFNHTNGSYRQAEREKCR